MAKKTSKQGDSEVQFYFGKIYLKEHVTKKMQRHALVRFLNLRIMNVLGLLKSRTT